jgi:putative endonuclease
MQEPRTYYVYIMASASRVLYTGVTNDLARRAWEHKQTLVPGFTRKYNVTRLVYYEPFERVEDAIAREKEIKGWLRKKKIALIEGRNGTWKDLSWGWFDSEVLRCAQNDKASAACAQLCHPERSEWPRNRMIKDDRR